MGQMERGVNRIYGVERDRPASKKYKRALILAVAVGPLLAAALLMIGFAPDPDLPSTTTAGEIWAYGRWPVAAGLVVIALALVLRLLPEPPSTRTDLAHVRRPTAVLRWLSATVLLAFGFRLSATFPQTYGPLAGVIALLLWGYLSALAIFYGVAVAAELESCPSAPSRNASAGRRSLTGHRATRTHKISVRPAVRPYGLGRLRSSLTLLSLSEFRGELMRGGLAPGG